MKGPVAALVAGGVLVAGALTVWATLDRAAPIATTNTVPAIPVTVGTVTAADVPVFLHGIGSVQAFNTITIRSRVDGPIVRVDFVEGQEVEIGASLFQIDPAPYRAALAQAQAAKAKDSAQLESAQLDLARFTKLSERGFQTQQGLDQQKALVAQLKATIEGDQAQIDVAQLNLDYTHIHAPIAGRLGARLVDIGNLVRAGEGTPLARITQLRPIFVSFTLPQDSVDEVRQGQMKAPLVVEAFSSDNTRNLAQGELTLIDNAIDAATGTIRLKAQFANQNERLWPGEFVNVRVTLSIRRAVPTVPSEAVQDGPDGSFIYVVEPGDTVRRKPVQVAAIQDGIAVITDGVSPGERVVVSGQFRLINGARIAAAPPRASTSSTGAGPAR
jgi:membrane fusion protein, multidrug efflux system